MGVRGLQCMAGGVWTGPPCVVKVEPAGGCLSAGFWGPWQASPGILRGTVLACKMAMKGKVYQGKVFDVSLKAEGAGNGVCLTRVGGWWCLMSP